MEAVFPLETCGVTYKNTAIFTLKALKIYKFCKMFVIRPHKRLGKPNDIRSTYKSVAR
jgi:hypothetical protein